MNLRSVRGFCKAAKRPYMKLFTSDYRDGTARLSLELQGLYFRILTYLHDGEVVPADPQALATFLSINRRTVKALVPKLIEAGKLYESNGELRNKRIDRDLEPNSDRDQPDFEPTSNRNEAELVLNSDRTFQKSELNQESENHAMEKATSTAISIATTEDNSQPTSVVPDAAKGCAAKIDLDELDSRLREACNGALANSAVAQGLHDLSTPIMWLNAGADLELDVIPTLRGIGKREHGKGISSWGYFTKPVTAAKNRREAGLPEVAAETAATAPKKSALSIIAEMEAAGEF